MPDSKLDNTTTKGRIEYSEVHENNTGREASLLQSQPFSLSLLQHGETSESSQKAQFLREWQRKGMIIHEGFEKQSKHKRRVKDEWKTSSAVEKQGSDKENKGRGEEAEGVRQSVGGESSIWVTQLVCVKTAIFTIHANFFFLSIFILCLYLRW